MKLGKVLLCFLGLLLYFNVGWAADVRGHQLPTNYLTVLGAPIGSLESDVVASLGTPGTYEVSRGKDGIAHILKYGGTKFLFLDYRNDGVYRLASVTLTNRDATIVGNIAVGDSIEALDSLFDFQPDLLNQASNNPNNVMLFYGRYVPRSDVMTGIWFFVEKNKAGKYIIKFIKVGNA